VLTPATSQQIEAAVRELYDGASEREWQRMDRHRTEFAVTLRTLTEHLPPPPARILDCGGGPGRYAIELARQGYEVTLFDLSPGNLALARAKADEAGVSFTAIVQGTATDLSCFDDSSFDAVLLMGPLYHLLEEHERFSAVAGVKRIVRPGGLVFAAFITRYAAHRWAAANEPTWIVDDPQAAQTLLDTGRLAVRPLRPGGFIGYFAHPDEVVPLIRRAGLEVRAVLGVDSLVSQIEEGVNQLTGDAWERWADLSTRVASDPVLFGAAEHLLVLAQRPMWRDVLRRLAERLNTAGVAYKIVGSTCLALHGVPLTPGDIDVETDAAGAYRIQDLWPEVVVDPVRLRTSPIYRSHLGHLSIDGIMVEIMGAMERPDGDSWVSTAASTETMVELDGVPVPVAWLEEEALAYVRRGRLERTAQCLPYCDRERLLALLRRETPTAVI
jgi:S-adenosylmethionine-dependent methyltransferase